ncbi:MAG TPA: twin-arginine translocase TatA/TatE family subunit [Bacilli bacterium]|nr:twin-arginine translocase TatA/TatE family subunit [Bacilli bacterium]
MFSNIGVPGLILIMAVALVLFGPQKMPELGRALGKSLKEFKQGLAGIVEDDERNPREG